MNNKINTALRLIAKLSIDKASQVLSKIIKTGASIELENVFMADIQEVTQKFMSEGDQEVVGSFIDLVGDTQFKFLFYVNMADSLVITDLMLRKEAGSTKEFNLYASSAINELGNIISSAVTNVFAKDFQIKLKPSPPQGICDFESVLLGEHIVNAVGDQNEILFIESVFKIVKHNIACQMFILPTGDSEEVLSYISDSIA